MTPFAYNKKIVYMYVYIFIYIYMNRWVIDTEETYMYGYLWRGKWDPVGTWKGISTFFMNLVTIWILRYYILYHIHIIFKNHSNDNVKDNPEGAKFPSLPLLTLLFWPLGEAKSGASSQLLQWAKEPSHHTDETDGERQTQTWVLSPQRWACACLVLWLQETHREEVPH